MDSSRVFIRNCHYVLVFLVLVMVLTGCRAPQEAEVDYSKPLPPGELALRKLIDPADIPGEQPLLAVELQLAVDS